VNINAGPFDASAAKIVKISIASKIGRLYAAGARTFIVWRAPNVELTPAIRTLDHLRPGAIQLGEGLTGAFNTGLDGAGADLEKLPGIRIVRLDAYGLLKKIVDHPEAFGLTDVTSPCVTPNIAPFTCDRPDEFLFWDGIHPTKAVHAIIAQEAASMLSR
jgi:phospholipase/lecithinase/hemolysin